MLVITGATGQLGRKIVENIVELVPRRRRRRQCPRPDKAADLKDAGIRVRQGDYDNAESLRHAWEAPNGS